MTRQAYFEMCEMLGEEPIDSEIPVEFEDFPLIVQQCFSIHNILPDVWDTMGGNYLGKDYGILYNLLDTYEIEKADHFLVLQVILQIDSVRAKILADKLKSKTPSPTR